MTSPDFTSLHLPNQHGENANAFSVSSLILFLSSRHKHANIYQNMLVCLSKEACSDEETSKRMKEEEIEKNWENCKDRRQAISMYQVLESNLLQGLIEVSFSCTNVARVRLGTVFIQLRTANQTKN